MGRLLLVRHSLPAIDARIPAAEWALSEDGLRRCVALAQQVAEYAPDVVVCSQEPKASETGRLLAAQLGIPQFTATNLHEHERPAPSLLSQEDFQTTLAELFARPDKLIFGTETAAQAQKRFADAIEVILKRYHCQTVVIVAHGTVISLFVAQKTGIVAFPFWKRLGLPSVVALSLPDFKLEKVIEHIV